MPTVFLRHRKTKCELPVSFFIYPLHRKRELELLFSFFVFPWLRTTGLQLSFPLFVFYFCKTLKNGIWTSIFVFGFHFLLHYLKTVQPIKQTLALFGLYLYFSYLTILKMTSWLTVHDVTDCTYRVLISTNSIKKFCSYINRKLIFTNFQPATNRVKRVQY